MSGHNDPSVPDDAGFELMLRAALQAPPLPVGYATRMAARAREAAMARMIPWWRRPALVLAFGGGWAAASLMAGIFVANLYLQTDFDPVLLADMALGTLSSTGVN